MNIVSTLVMKKMSSLLNSPAFSTRNSKNKTLIYGLPPGLHCHTCPKHRKSPAELSGFAFIVTIKIVTLKKKKKYKNQTKQINEKCLIKRRGFEGERINEVYEPCIFTALQINFLETAISR